MTVLPGGEPTGPTWDDKRQLNRQAWWAWLTVADDALAERIAEYFDGLPPWLDSGPWFLAGLVPGALLGGLGVALLPPDQPLPTSVAVATVMTLFVASSLARREAWSEEAWHFAARVSVLLLHVPYLLAAGLAAAAFLPAAGQWTPTTAACLAVGAVVVLIAALRVTTPRLLTHPDYNLLWPSLAGLPSLAFRTLVLIAAGAASLTGQVLWLGVLGVLAALTALLTARLQDRLAEALETRLRGRSGPRSRDWPARYRPVPYAFEAALLTVDGSAGARELATQYADSRDYTAAELDAAMGRLRLGGPNDARTAAAAMCALELWANPDSPPDAVYRGFARLDAVARRWGQALDLNFWLRFGQLAVGRPLHARGLVCLLDWRETMGLGERDAWQRLTRLDWAEALLTADEADRARLVDGVLALLGAIGDPLLAHQGLGMLETVVFEHLGEPLPAGYRSKALALCEALAPAGDAPRPQSSAAYGLELRRWAYAAAAGGDPAPWYGATAALDELPASRRWALLPPAVSASLWAAVLRVVEDPEERHRQAERYRKEAGRVARG